MPGVIQTNHQDCPIYESRPLENVPQNRKLMGGFLIVFSVICLISSISLGVVLMVENKSRETPISNKEMDNAIALFMACITNMMFAIAPLVLSISAYANCCSVQRVRCFLAKKGDALFLSLMLIFICLLQVLGSTLLSEYLLFFKIATVVCCSATCILSIGSIYFAKKYCQCKECHDIKDVYLTYNDVTIAVTEQQQITSSSLKTWFAIPNSNRNRLVVQVIDREIVYEFNRESRQIQLHEGNYLIREMTTNILPHMNCAAPKCTTAFSKLSETNDKAMDHTIMTID